MRLIDADALVWKIKTEKGGTPAMLVAVNSIPTVDAVPVVRCKDCKEYDEEQHWCGIRDSYGWDYKPNDYCSYGVRKAGRRCG